MAGFAWKAAGLAGVLLGVPAAGCGGTQSGGPDGAAADMTFISVKHESPPRVAWQGDAGENDGGPLVLREMRLVSIVAANDELATQLLDFGDGVAKSAWYTRLAEVYALGPAGQSVRLTGPAINDARVDENVMRRYLEAALASATPPIVPDGHTVILLYLPRSTQFIYNGVPNECDQISRDDKTFGAYHLPFGTLGDMWAPVMRCMLPKGQTALEQLTIFASQQIIDCLTNPLDRGFSAARLPDKKPWDDSPFLENIRSGTAEAAELCSVETRFVEGTSTYQRFLSNQSIAANGDPCAPALAVPYYSVSTEIGWYGAAAGATLTIDLLGWSTAPLDDWPIRVLIGPSGDPLYRATARVESETNVDIAGVTYQTINNGRTVPLKVVIPGNAKSGWWNVVHVRSFRLDATGAPLPGDDYAHRWTVGAYVP